MPTLFNEDINGTLGLKSSICFFKSTANFNVSWWSDKSEIL